MSGIREVDDAVRTIEAMLDETERKRPVGSDSWDGSDVLAHAESSCFALRESGTVTDDVKLAELEMAEQFCSAAQQLLENQKEDLLALRQWLVDGCLELDRKRIGS